MIGRKLGSYEVLSKLGEGGMGEVYRARDSRLGRDVAIKILPDTFANDPDRLMRFEREARMLAALNHPHIAQVYGFEASPGAAGLAPAGALVMELVDGDDLAAAIARGPVPIDEALAMARQIAEALDAAHELGIVHRDLKPANIKVRGDGAVKVLDFGLAKALDHTPAAERGAHSATMTSPVRLGPAGGRTELGVILGTAAYMAPEQAKGRPVDRRADVWAFGCVLYEMLTGERAFKGDDVSDTIVAILRDDPDWGKLPTETPAHVRTLLARCLQKDPRKRLRDIGDARLELDAVATTPLAASTTAASERRAPTRERAAWAAAALLAMSTLGVWVWMRPVPVAPPAPIRFTIAAPLGRGFAAQPGSLALSNDGRMLAFVAPNSLGRATLWVRALGEVEAREIAAGGAGNAVSWAAASPGWSPDGRQLVLTAGTSLGGAVRKVDLDGGPTLTLADWGASAIWGTGGVIVYTGRDGGLYRVNDSGGAGTPVTTVDTAGGEIRHVASQFLPDGRRFLFEVEHRDSSKAAVYVGSIDSAARTAISGVTARAVYADGYIWHLDDGVLRARAFDPVAATVTGDAIPVVEDVVNFAVAAQTLVTNRRDISGQPMAWFDANGQAAQVGPSDAYQGTGKPDLSRDGRRLTFARRSGSATEDIWVIDLERNVSTRLTSHAADDIAPVFSADGSRIIFGSNRGGSWGIYQRAVDGSGDDELLYESAPRKQPTSVSPDGATLLFMQNVPETGADIWALPLLPQAAPRTPVPISVTESLDGFAVFSPDGKWIAYCGGDRLEGDQIYVVPFPPTGARTRLSTSFGSAPRWSTNGDAVFFGMPDFTIMRVPVTTAGGIVRPGVPAKWLTLPALFGHLAFLPDRPGTRALAPVGQRLTNQSLTVAVNWRALLER